MFLAAIWKGQYETEISGSVFATLYHLETSQHPDFFNAESNLGNKKWCARDKEQQTYIISPVIMRTLFLPPLFLKQNSQIIKQNLF